MFTTLSVPAMTRLVQQLLRRAAGQGALFGLTQAQDHALERDALHGIGDVFRDALQLPDDDVGELPHRARALGASAGIARPSHRSSTAGRDLPRSAALACARSLDVLQSTPHSLALRKRHISRHLATLATNTGEKGGLVSPR